MADQPRAVKPFSAAHLLKEHQVAAKQIISDDGDSALYVDDHGRPRTAWFVRRNGQVEIETVPGFQVDPPEQIAGMTVYFGNPTDGGPQT